MKNYLVVFSTMLFCGVAFSQNLQDVELRYKSGVIRCEGSIVGAEKISVLKKFDNTYDLIIESGNIIQNQVSILNAFVAKNKKYIWFEANDPRVVLYANFETKKSYVEIKCPKKGFGVDNSIDFKDEDNYRCKPLVVEQ